MGRTMRLGQAGLLPVVPENSSAVAGDTSGSIPSNALSVCVGSSPSSDTPRRRGVRPRATERIGEPVRLGTPG